MSLALLIEDDGEKHLAGLNGDSGTAFTTMAEAQQVAPIAAPIAAKVRVATLMANYQTQDQSLTKSDQLNAMRCRKRGAYVEGSSPQSPDMSRADRSWRAPLTYLDDPLHDRLWAGVQSTFGHHFSLDFFDEQHRRGLRGLLCYWLCPEPELECFIESRRRELQGLYGIDDTIAGDSHAHGEIFFEHGQRIFVEVLTREAAQGGYPDVSATKLEHIKLLERADDLRTFPQFSALPAVVRFQIYDLVLQPRATNDGADAVPQPPITMVSRQFRRDILPLYYQQQHITVRLEYHGPTQQLRNGGFCMPSRMVRYLSSQTRGDLMQIRRFTVSAALPVGKVPSAKKSNPIEDCRDCPNLLCCVVNLDEYTVEQQLVTSIHSRDRREHDHGQTINAVQRVLLTINGRSDGRIRGEDFIALRDAVEWAAFSGARPIVMQCVSKEYHLSD